MQIEVLRSMVLAEGALLVLLSGYQKFDKLKGILLPFSYVLIFISFSGKVISEMYYIFTAVSINFALVAIIIYCFWRER